MRYLLIVCLLLCAGADLSGQNSRPADALMRFMGSDDPEELDPDEVERLENLMERPVRINSVSDAQLRACGLFTPYQVVVIRDHVSRHGTIMSMTELSMLDGFGESFVRRVAPFVSLQCSDQSLSGFRHDAAVRTGGRWNEDDGVDGSYGLKYRVSAGDRLSVSVAASRSAGTDTWLPSSFTGNISWKFRRAPLRLTAGDFNARFGQGLVLWSCSFLNTLTDPDSFMKKPTGITQPWSFSASGRQRGAAAELTLGSFQIIALASFAGMQFSPAVNIAWHGRHGQVSMTGTMEKSGIDAAFCIRGVNIFGEAAYDWLSKVPLALAGTRFRVGEGVDMAAQVRAFMNDQFGTAIAVTYSSGQKGQVTISADAIYYPVSKDDEDPYSVQFKTQLTGEMMMDSRWKFKFRFSERIRTWGLPFRTDLRADIIYNPEPFTCTARVNLLSCDGLGFLSYLEGGYIGERHSVYLRQGVFLVDDWDDRIYVYERDAPGSFNAPAMYGRGVWTSATYSSKISRTLRLYARTSYVGYPMMEKKKPGKAELKLQLQYRF